MKETHAHIDELVRDRLNTLPPAAPTAVGWEALERSLDAPNDDVLRNALTSLTAADSVAGWQALERKMDHRSVDELQLADGLNALTPAVAAGSWAALAAKMDRQNDEAIDAIVADGLARSAPTASSGWAALAARLELIGWRRSTVAAWKITEGALLLSIILLFFRFGPALSDRQAPEITPAGSFPLPIAAAVPNGKPAATVTSPQPARAKERTSARADQRPLTDKTTRLARKTKLNPSVAPIEATTKNDVVKDAAVVSGTDPYLPEPIAALDIVPLKKRVIVPSPMLHLAEIDNSVPVYYYVNAFVSPLDVNQVITPGHTAGEFDINSERRYTTGFTTGGLLDVNKGRNTLQIGIIYSRRAYLPASLKWRYQDYFTPRTPVEGYSKFVYHAVEFPFSYKHTLSETARWRVAARVGMSLSVIAKPVIKDHDEVVAKFEAFEEEIAEDGYTSPSSLIPGPSRPRVPITDFSSERKLKDPPKGWLEGGSILANSSFYLGGGITVERILNPRWSLYLSPSIGRVIYLGEGGIGPYQDRINLGSLRMGSRYRFGGKK